MPVILRSLVLLAATGASAAVFIYEATGSWLPAFIRSNVLSLSNRYRVMIGMAAGAALAVAAGLCAWRHGKAQLRRFAHILAPGILLGFLPPLCVPVAWSNVLHAAIAIACFVLLGERLYRLSFAAAAETSPARLGALALRDDPAFGQDGLVAPPAPGPLRRLVATVWASIGGALRRARAAVLTARVRRWGPPVLVVLGAVGYAVYMSVFTLFMHGRFQTFGYDLGQYDNIFWSTLHGYPMRDAPLNLIENWSQLRGHAELSVFFFLPFYAIKPGGPILLVIQSCMLGLGAIPLYRFAARRLPRSYAALIAIAYLFYPPMHGLQFYDFHFQPVASTLVLFVIDFVDDRRYWLCGLAFLVAIGCREDIPVGLAILGTFLILSGHRPLPGLVMAAAATAYFVVMRFIIMPRFGSWFFHGIYKDLLPSGANNFGGIIATLITNPVFTFVSLLESDKLKYALQILVPLAFLPVRRSYLVASVVPGSIFTVLTTQYPPTIDIGFQYSAHLIPYIFPAAVLAIAAFGATGGGLARRRAAVAAVITGTALCGVFWGAIPPRAAIHGGFGTIPMRAPTAAERQKHRDLVELHAQIPPKAWVAVSEQEMPHISRLNMKSLRDTADADYLLYGTGSAGAVNAERARVSGEYEKIGERPGLVLLKRKTAPAAAAPSPPAPAHPPVPVPLPALPRPQPHP